MKEDEDDEAANWFHFLFPRMKEAEHKPDGKLPQIIEFIQYPGDTVFVPGGWWHAVLNLDNTIAITENVINHASFEKVWIDIRRKDRTMAYIWL